MKNSKDLIKAFAKLESIFSFIQYVKSDSNSKIVIPNLGTYFLGLVEKDLEYEFDCKLEGTDIIIKVKAD